MPCVWRQASSRCEAREYLPWNFKSQNVPSTADQLELQLMYAQLMSLRRPNAALRVITSLEKFLAIDFPELLKSRRLLVIHNP